MNPIFSRNLEAGWRIQQSRLVEASGQEISSAGFPTSAWFPATIPSTVLGTLVNLGIYPDPYQGTRLQEIPRKIFEGSWWFRTELVLSQEHLERFLSLRFDGVNYSADIWFNGKRLADSSIIRGAFRHFALDITRSAREGRNVLALEVFPPKSGDFSTGFVDWNPPPPDRNMGIFRTVCLRTSDPVSVEDPFVLTSLPEGAEGGASLTLRTTLVNHSVEPVTGTLQGQIESTRVEKRISLDPGEQREIELRPDEFPALHFPAPRLWWPHLTGPPELYDLKLAFLRGGKPSDEVMTHFGIREIEDYFTEDGHRGFRVNGRTVLIKGAGWTDDLLLRDTPESLETQIQYVRHLNLNCIRLEGIWGKDHTLYDLCDRSGILMMVGWSCHWEHEKYLEKPVHEMFGGVYSDEDIELVGQSWRDQVLWLRNHPSIFVWAVASDKLPHPELEKNYRKTFEECDPTRPYLVSTGGVGSEQAIITKEKIFSEVSGSSGVKMLGPYAYTPPVYWFIDRKLGGAYGFNTETGPGVQPPLLESIRRMIPADHEWPVDEVWSFHCGLNEFRHLERFLKALSRRLGEPQSLQDFSRKAQLLNYELMRPMFEAFQANKGVATGVIQWMLNAAWPKFYWQLYDWYLVPNAAFYATRQACKPLHLVYDYGNRGVYLVNDFSHPVPGLQARVRLFDLDSKSVYEEWIPVDSEPDSSQKVTAVPEVPDLTTTYFLDLRLLAPGGEELDSGIYWLSTRPDVLDFDTRVQPWPYYTPSREYADLRMLNDLPEAEIRVRPILEQHSAAAQVRVILENPGKHLAFFIELQMIGKHGGQILIPSLWDDNYVTLLPGEMRTLTVDYRNGSEELQMRVSGWNVACRTLDLLKG